MMAQLIEANFPIINVYYSVACTRRPNTLKQRLNESILRFFLI